MVSHNDKEKEKEHAIQLNDKLKKDLEQAKKKLAESENKLKVNNDPGYQTGEDPFDLVLTKEEGEGFFGQESKPNNFI